MTTATKRNKTVFYFSVTLNGDPCSVVMEFGDLIYALKFKIHNNRTIFTKKSRTDFQY